MVYVQFIDGKLASVFKTLPKCIWLSDGTTRTSLEDLSTLELDKIGLFEYQEVTPIFDPERQYPGVNYTLDHNKRLATLDILDKTENQIISEKEAALKEQLEAEQAGGCLCSNGIRLKTGEEDLLRFTQLMVGLLAFQPKTVVIRDYEDNNHEVSLSVAMQMMGELFAFGQALITKKWAETDKIKAEAAK